MKRRVQEAEIHAILIYKNALFCCLPAPSDPQLDLGRRKPLLTLTQVRAGPTAPIFSSIFSHVWEQAVLCISVPTSNYCLGPPPIRRS